MILAKYPLLCTAIVFFAPTLVTSRAASQRRQNSSAQCRYFPGDSEWPSAESWQQLNSSVSGRLLASQSPGHVCHDPTYDADACAAVQTTWTLPQAQWVDPAGFTAAYQQNASCNPHTPRDTPCLQGNYVNYAINVSSPSDVSAGVKFAQENNIRLVIKNTGHDYLGKSTGAGSLSIWTHNLKHIEFLDYASPAYTGPAAKFGAGVQGFEAYQAAFDAGYQVLGGVCPTVGIVGGFTQGGGHSLLSSKHGMAADQTLEWEVVTADGSLVTASPTENSDLYWALSGGGGGTYGVVVALTVKAYPDSVVAGAVGGFAAEGLTEDTYWDAVESFLSILPALVDAGAHTTFITQKTVFTLYEITIPGGAEGQIQALVEPWTTHLAEHNITYQLYFSVLPNFKAHVDTYLGPPPYGYDAHSSLLEGGVMFNRSTVAQHGHDIITHMRKIATTTDFFFPAFAFDASRPPSSPNALLPAWRESLMYLESQQYWNFSVPFQAMAEQERLMTEVVMPPLQDLASGAYMNEADFMNPRWKEEFYGENYGKLESIKKKWDPNDLFYATTAVGSEAWAAQQDGRLCRP